MALTRPRYSQIPDSDYKNSCRIVTTTDVTLTGSAPLTYDGVTLVQYDRVLVAGQTDKTQNGIYSVSTLGSGSNGTWVRSKDANANDRLTAGMNTFVEEGTYTGQFWHLLTPGPIVLGVTELVFGQITGNAAGTSSQVQYNLNGSIAGAANLRYDSATGNVLIGGGTASTSNVTGALTVNGGIGVTGNINVGANVSADKFYTTNGLFWAANGLAFSSGLEVSEINTANTVLSNISTQVTSIRFDRDTGFNVTELNPGNIKVSLGSSFKTWHVPGQADLVAAAEDEVTFFGNGIDITTNPTFPKSITFIANNSVLEANIGAYQLYANANAAAQAVLIDTINSNVSAANAAIQSLSANIGTLVGGASEALDTLLELGNALGNSSSFSSTVVNWLSNISANVAAANVAITTLDANVGTLFLGNASTNANLGAFQLYANANIGTLFVGNAITNANLGAFQLYANANIGSIYNQLNILDANVGAFELYANANIGSIYNQLNILDANVGAYQLYANANAVSIQTQINSITTSSNANISAFLTTYTGNISAGNIDVTGNISGVNYILANNYVYSANGVSILAAHDANIGTLHLGNISTQANLGAYQTYTNVSIATLDGNIGTLFLGNASTNANLGAYQTYTNVSIATLEANVGTLFLGNASTNANLGAYQLYANANIGSIYNQLNTLDANVGAFELYANANIGTLFLGNASTNANLGAYQIYANANAASLQISITAAYSEITALDSATQSNAATQAVAINALSANINAFQSYANTKIGTNNNSNLVVASTTDSVSPITGAVVVAGGMGIGGNLYVAGNIYASNLTAISISTLSVQDPLLYLTADTPFPYNYDIGFFSHYQKESGDEKHTGLARDYTTDIWNFFSNATSSPGATINWSETDLIYDTVRVGDLIVSNTTPSTSTTTGALRVAGGAGVVGALYITNTGDVSANIGALHLGNIRVNANLGAYQLYANNSISTLIQGNTSTQANLGAFQTYANANIGTLFVSNASTQANLGAYQTYANASFATLDANVGTLYLGNVSTQANLGLLYDSNVSTQANIGSIRTQLDTLDANVGSYQVYANVYLGVSTTFAVTNSGSSEYVINGENNPALYLVRGQRYNFSVDAAGHPFWIKTAASIGSGDQYNTGVTNNGEDAGVVVFEVPLTAPDVLYYISQFDIAMTNELRVVNFATLDANIGTLFLGNASTNANLGAFQTYANATFTTYSNANVTAYLPIHTGNISAGNIDVTNKVSAEKIYTTDGVYWSGNGVAFINGSTYTADTAPPVSGNVKGDQWYNTVTDVLFEYLDNGVSQYWVDVQTSVIAANAVVTIPELIQANLGAYQLYANANIGTLYLGNISTQANLGAFQTYANANIGTLFLGNASTNANLGAFQTYANSKIGTNTNSNLVVDATTASTTTTTGALVVKGGAGIAGNAYIGANLVVTQSGLFQGPYNENSLLSGVFVGNTGTGTPSPRIGFFTGNTARNWQIDNFDGEFRWFVPGSSKMTLYSTGVLSVAGGYTVNGKKAVNGPAFRAYITTGQTISSTGSQIKVTFGGETFDTDGCFASSTFTPTVEGYYQLNATVRISGPAGTGENMLILYKNGSEYARGTNGSGTEIGGNFYSMQVSDIVYANGTTDNFEVYIQQGSGSNKDTTAGQNISYFSGVMVRGA